MIDRRLLLGQGGLALAGSLYALGGADATQVSIADHGASVLATPADNLAAFRAALAATPPGGRLLVPAHVQGSYGVDTSGGLSKAIRIERPVTVLLEGRIRTNAGECRRDPPYLFDVSAPDVAFVGSGMLSGPGGADDTNLQDDTTHSGLIYVTGDRFRFAGPTITDVPKIGIPLWKCRGADVSAAWRGGIRDYVTGHTGLFGVKATGGGGHRIHHNRFERDAAGRRLITGYFAGGSAGPTAGDEIAYNTADVHEKIAYLFTNNSTIHDCSVVDALQTDVVRIVGSGNAVSRIKGSRIKGGVSVYNGHGNVIRECTFEEIRQSGVFCSFSGSYADGFDGTVIEGNSLTAAKDVATLQDGICLYAQGSVSGTVIADNRVDAPSPGSVWKNCIRVEMVPPYYGREITIRDNMLAAGINGISVRRLLNEGLKGNFASRLHGGRELLRITS